MKKYFVCFMISLMMVVGICGCSSSGTEDSGENQEVSTTDLSALKERGYIIMGLDDTFAPMGFRDTDGELVGFDIDMANEVSKIIGVEIKFQPIDWSMKENELKAGNVDLLWNGYSITEERKKVVSFSQPYLDNAQIIVTKSDSPLNTKEDLAGAVVSLQKESSALEAVQKEPELMASFKDGAPIEFDTNNEAFMDLDAGRSDAVVADEVLARYYMRLNGEENYKVLEGDYGDEQYGIGMRQEDTELLAAIDGALTELKENGKYDEIYSKWFA